MRNIILILCLCTTVYCVQEVQDVATPRKKHILIHGGILYYLTFLAIKVKFVIVIGAIITALVFFGKLFAFLKYSSIFLSKHYNCDHASSKIIVEKPYFDHYPGHDISFDPSFSHHDYPPHHHHHHHPEIPESEHKRYGRSFETSMKESVHRVRELIKGFDLTEIAFNQMNIREEACRRKFVCEVDQRARRNPLLGFGLYLFSDTDLNRYRSNSTQNALKMCADSYRECEKLKNNT